MSRSGDELILNLASILGTDLNKTAAKKDKDEDKDEDKKCPECGHKDCDCGCDPETGKGCKCKKDKEDKKDDKKKKASVIIQSLSKLANDLDEMGEDDASSLVDDALRVIVKSLESTAALEDNDSLLGEPGSEFDSMISDEEKQEEQYDEAMTKLKEMRDESDKEKDPLYEMMKGRHEDMPEDDFDKGFNMPEDEEDM